MACSARVDFPWLGCRQLVRLLASDGKPVIEAGIAFWLRTLHRLCLEFRRQLLRLVRQLHKRHLRLARMVLALERSGGTKSTYRFTVAGKRFGAAATFATGALWLLAMLFLVAYDVKAEASIQRRRSNNNKQWVYKDS